MGEKVTDASLITASIGEPERFAAIFDRHFVAVHAYLQRRVGRELADELAGDTFVTAFAARRRYEPSHENARPWLFGIAGNLARHQFRTDHRRVSAYARTGPSSVVDEGEDVDARLDAEASRAVLGEGLASLSEADREALLLYVWADLSYVEIGQALEIPTGTVKSRISRARARLRELIAASGQVLDEEKARNRNG